MLDLLTSSAWALESKYYNVAKNNILSRMEQGMPALSDADLKPRRYAAADAQGYPTMWVANSGELVGVPQPAAQGLRMAESLAGLLGAQGAAGRSNTANTSGSKVAVIPVQGAILKRGGYWSLGTKDLVALLAAANRDPEISAIVLDIDSPGGQVDGTEEFAQAVKQSEKPVVAYIDGLGASAAYWIASQCASIFINSASTGYAGSLGVLCMHVDQSAYLEKEGYKVTILRSTRATDKARMNGVEALTPELRQLVEADLDQIGETFISAVESGRAGKLSSKEDVFTGKVYNGADAKKFGLVDAIGSLQDAVNKAAQLAKNGRSGPSASTFAQTLTATWQTSQN